MSDHPKYKLQVSDTPRGWVWRIVHFDTGETVRDSHPNERYLTEDDAVRVGFHFFDVLLRGDPAPSDWRDVPPQ